MNRHLVLATLLLVSATFSFAQERPDFSGEWLLDTAESGPPQDVWGQRRPGHLVVEQTSEALVVSTGAESIVGARAVLTYRLDGKPTTVEDTSLGEIPNFKRQIRTDAKWHGDALETSTTHFAEASDGVVPGGITRVLTYSLLSDGSRMQLERTGFRERPPAMLHGVIYRQQDDLVYAKDRAIYVRAVE